MFCFVAAAPVEQAIGLVTRLELETQASREAVERAWSELQQPPVDRDRYLAMLRATFGIASPLECACRYTRGLDRYFDTRELTRAGLLAQDLLSLDLTAVDVANVPLCLSITPFLDVAEALGWVYASARTTAFQAPVLPLLSGRVRVHAACYLEAIEGWVARRWPGFAMLVEQMGTDPVAARSLVAGATAGFACLADWIATIEG